MTPEIIKAIEQEFFKTHTDQFELTAADDEFVYFYHTLMEYTIGATLKDGILIIKE
jgi:hypothetical protein